MLTPMGEHNSDEDVSLAILCEVAECLEDIMTTVIAYDDDDKRKETVVKAAPLRWEPKEGRGGEAMAVDNGAENEDKEGEEEIDKEGKEVVEANNQEVTAVLQEVGPSSAAAAATNAPLPTSKHEATKKAFRHIKLQGTKVHAHPSLDDEVVNALLKHVAASGYAAAKDLFLLVCDIEGAILVVSPHMLPIKSEEEGEELVCDHVARNNGQDMRILTPLLIYCSTSAARWAVTDALSGVEAHLGQWCLLCSRPIISADAHRALGLSLQVRAYALSSVCP